MAIDLPPVIPPQASSVEKIENYAAQTSAALLQYQVAGYTLRITGNQHLQEEQVASLMAAASTPAQAVNALNQAYYQLGHLLVTVYFAHVDQTIYVHVVNGNLAAIKAPEAIAGYFDGLVGEQHLTRSEFDAKRVLADLQSKRAGVDYSVSYQLEADPQAFTMVFTPSEVEEHDATDLSLGLNNLGNRFLGRYFANAGVKHDFDNGLQASFSYDRSLTEWGETNGGDFYDGYTLRLNKPTPWGLYGLEGRYVEYARDTVLTVSQPAEGEPAPDPENGAGGGNENCLGLLNPICELLGDVVGIILPPPAPPPGTVVTDSLALRIEAETKTVAVSGEQILSSDTLHRLTLSQRLEHSDNSIDVVGFGNLLDERVSSAELGLKYNRLLRFAGVPTQIMAQGFVEAGLNADSGTLGSDDRRGTVAIGRRSSEFVKFKPRFSAKMAVVDWATLNVQFLSQFSDGTQLPLQHQFVLGGGSLSAYLPGVLVGDSGSYAKLSFDGNGLPLLGAQFKPSLFIEHGQTWYEDARGSAGDTRQLTDAGLRLSANWGKVLETQLIAALPVADDNVEQSFLDQMEVDFFWQLKLTF